MPGAVIAFFVLQGLAVGHTLLKEVADIDFGIDRSGDVGDRFEAWSAPRINVWTRTDHCDVTFFATANRDVEIRTDEAFSRDGSLKLGRELGVGVRIRKSFSFIELEYPHKVIVVREVSFTCLGLPGSTQKMRGLNAEDMEGFK